MIYKIKNEETVQALSKGHAQHLQKTQPNPTERPQQTFCPLPSWCEATVLAAAPF